MTKKLILLPLALSLILTTALPALSADSQAFDRIFAMGMDQLTERSQTLLEELYPEEDWDAWDFPKFVYTSDAVETGYSIAVKEPQLLMPIPCYCFCDQMGHKNLLHCFLKRGEVGGKFDDHAAACNICYGQAMLAFLWKHEAGASQEEILKGMEKRFERLLKERGMPTLGN